MPRIGRLKFPETDEWYHTCCPLLVGLRSCATGKSVVHVVQPALYQNFVKVVSLGTG